MTSMLFLCFLFLIAGVIAVPLATRLGLGSVLGYLLAGIVISPLLHSFSVDVVSIQHIAEFGVVMMLFLVGLELEPKMLWEMRSRLLGLGGLQVALTALLITAVVLLFGQPFTVALTIGLILALSSTAIVLQTLNEKGLMKSDGGQAGFSVLLFQDIAVIPMLAVIPLLAMPELMELAHTETGGHAAPTAAEHGDTAGHGADFNLMEQLSGWQRALATLAAIALVIAGGSYLTQPLFRFIALANLREIFIAAALMMVTGIAFLMNLVGLSAALGTFLAGVVLANSEYRHELESDIEPFKGLLLGLFFITVGASIDFALFSEHFVLIVGAALGLIAIKALVMLVLAIIFKVQGADRWLFALGLAQAGEFGFVLLSFSVANAVIPQDIASLLLLVVTLSMLLTPAMFIFYDKILVPKFTGAEETEASVIEEQGSIIIAGHGRFGGVINRILLASGLKTVVLDYSSSHLDILRTFGIKSYFGDATRPDLLHAAGIENAKMLIIAIDDRHQATLLVRYVKQNYPGVYIVARALNRIHVYELYAAGSSDIIRDTFDSATRAGRSALEALGYHPYEAERMVRAFVDFDKHMLLSMAELYDPETPSHKNAAFVEKAKEFIAAEEAMMQGGDSSFSNRSKRGWTPPRDGVGEIP